MNTTTTLHLPPPSSAPAPAGSVLPLDVDLPATETTGGATDSRPLTTVQSRHHIEAPRTLGSLVRFDAGEDGTVIQIWEGTVLEVDEAEQRMKALLQAKRGGVADHVGDIDFEWVSDQDRDLVRPGAVFYLTLYKRRKRGGTIVNAEELRFRRLPSWTRRDADLMLQAADRLLIKGKKKPDAP